MMMTTTHHTAIMRTITLTTSNMRYTFLGGSLSDPALCGMQCDPVRRGDGKCIVNQKMAVALVVDADGRRHVVPRRRLRVNKHEIPDLG